VCLLEIHLMERQKALEGFFSGLLREECGYRADRRRTFQDIDGSLRDRREPSEAILWPPR